MPAMDCCSLFVVRRNFGKGSKRGFNKQYFVYDVSVPWPLFHLVLECRRLSLSVADCRRFSLRMVLRHLLHRPHSEVCYTADVAFSKRSQYLSEFSSLPYILAQIAVSNQGECEKILMTFEDDIFQNLN